MKRTTIGRLLFSTVLALLMPVAWSGDSLSFFNNWFVTGDYAVAGVGLRGTGVNGWATGTIHMTGLPDSAQPIAAFLYWSTVEPNSTPAARVGYFNGFQIQASVLGNPQAPNPPCGASGGAVTTGGVAGQVYRADVLRYLPVNTSNVAQANGNFTVKLPDAGGNGLYTNGASLIVIYKIVVPGLPSLVPLRAVVIYNGAFTMDRHSPGLTQNVAGFYQASSNAAARFTGIVANGQPGFSSPLSVNGRSVDTDPFDGAQGVRWDNPSYSINLSANASSFSTLATAGNNQTCLTWAAIVASVNVQDSDNDGLLDLWETKGLHRNTQATPATFGTCSDYPGEACVNLPAMGANPNKKDIFVQVDWMHGTGDGTGGTDGAGTHDHKPLLSALNSVASVFASHGVSLHFDVGQNYQGAQPACGNAPCPYIVPAASAQGGSDIDESTLVCRDTANHVCDYHVPYPVTSFEFGFASIRDGNHLINLSPHFAQNRRDVFRYSLFAHALAGPFDVNGHPVDPNTGLPTNVPKSYSGIAHRPGGGFMVTLGLWRSDIPANDQVGSAQVQAGTLMHELGHNLGLGHAGLSTKPNCMPNYPSIMNYLYQTRGLTDSSGNEQVDYSNGVLLPLGENLLTTAIPMGLFPGLQRYRVRYYGPLAPGQPSSQAAQLHCDGTPIKGGEAFEVRLEGLAISTPDWSNGTVPLGQVNPSFDVNYDGTKAQIFLDQPDWLTLNLQQIGTGYSFGGLSVGAFATDGGAYATDAGAFATDAGSLATGAGAFATDGGAFATDGGAFATDGGAFATDGGAFATDGGAFATDAGEIDETTVVLSSVDSPPSPTATPTVNSILVKWSPPDTGSIASYNIYRCAGAGCIPAAPAFKNVAGGTSTPSFNDAVNDFVHAGATCPATATCYNTIYVYVVTSVVVANAHAVESLFSKTVTGEVTHLFVLGNGQTLVYGTAVPAPTFTVYGDVAGSLASGGVSCAYSPSGPRNVGTYAIVCSGPASTSPTDGVTYNAAYLTFTPGVLKITPRPITVTAAASTKVYDGLLTSPATPTITTGSLAYTDTAPWTETYDNRNVGIAHVMTPAGTVSDGNGGNNYTVTFATAAGGIITVRNTTVTAGASTKVYDHTTISTSQPGVAPPLGSGDSAIWTETYDTPNVAANHVMSVTGSISDGNSGNNYSVTFSTISTGVITQAPASVTPNANGKIYHANDPALTGTLTGFLAADNVTATYTRVAGEDAGTYAISPNLSSATGLLTNYSITINPALFTISPAPQIVTFGPLSNQPFGVADFTVTAMASSGLPVTFTASGNCSVTPAGLVHLTATGTCNLTASQPGLVGAFQDYVPASTSQSFSITAIDFTKLVPQGYPGIVTTATATGISMTSDTGQTSAAWLPAQQTVANGFTTQFSFQITAGTTTGLADGFAFVIQSSPTGSGALGTTGAGGFLGYQGIPNSLAIEFDTYQNGWDPDSNHIAIQSNFTMANSSDHTTAAFLGIAPSGTIMKNLSDGAVHIATITYNGGTLSVLLDGTSVLSVPVDLTHLVLAPGGQAFVGFTAATGSDSETTQISAWSFSSN